MLRRIIFFSVIATSFQVFANVNYVRVMFNSDASSEATIAWNQISGENPVVCFGTSKPDEFNFTDSAIVLTSNNAKSMNTHFAQLSNLRANQKYYLSIKDSEGYSVIYYFSTVPNVPTERLSFIAGGDSRDLSETRRKGNKMVAKLKPHAVLFNGDFTGLDTPKQWVEWFDDWEHSITEDGRISPLVVTRGNHELTNRSIRNLFNVPHKRIYYDVQFGGTLLNIISLNSEIQKFGRQKMFLRNSLKDHAHFNWQIPQYHRPIRAHVAHKKEMKTEYKHFVPLFEKYANVRLCLENDSHTCKITWPIIQGEGFGSEEGFIRNDSIGIVYAGEGCWGAPLRTADDSKCWTRNAEAVNQVNWIFVDQAKIEVRTVLYENVAEVEKLTEKTRFNMPLGIALWTPSNGALVTISPR
ncbi:MAG: metallophosphoesterase family protein [Crocinitomicaceae bacterium]|nr:fibronectin type III domain-containing protein [Flavobacteriales bacterium]NQZ34931.1 metallophosphoesterase family protein [Crocinitomicaceae bacterium]